MMFKNWDGERWFLFVVAVLIFCGLGGQLYLQSRVSTLEDGWATSAKNLAEIGALADEIYALKEDMRNDEALQVGAYAYIGDMMVSSRIGKKFDVPKPQELKNQAEGYKDMRYSLRRTSGETFSRQQIANFMLYIEGNTMRMKVSKLTLNRAKGGGEDWTVDFTFTERMPLGEG